MLNEFFLYVLEDLHRQQGLGALQFTSADPAFVKETVELVYPLIPATATSPEMPETRAFSRQLVAYIAAFLPSAPYFKSNDSRISAVCDDQYSATLAMLEETADETFKAYMTRKTQGWFRRRPALGLPSPVRRRGRQPRPRRRPQRRGERRRRWGCDARASPGSGRVGRRGRISPHHAGGPGGGRRK